MLSTGSVTGIGGVVSATGSAVGVPDIAKATLLVKPASAMHAPSPRVLVIFMVSRFDGIIFFILKRDYDSLMTLFSARSNWANVRP